MSLKSYIEALEKYVGALEIGYNTGDLPENIVEITEAVTLAKADLVIPKGDTPPGTPRSCEALVTAVLQWRTASREHAKLGDANYFNHSPEREKTFRDSSKRLRKLGERMHKLLDEYEQQTTN